MLGLLYFFFLLIVYLFSSFFILFYFSSFYFFLVLQSVSLFALIHYFEGFLYNVYSICYVLMTLLSDIFVIYGFIFGFLKFLFLGFMLKLSFFPFLWFIPNMVLNMSYSLVVFLMFFHKCFVVLIFYYMFISFSDFYMFFILLSMFISSFYLILNKGSLKSLLVWSSKMHCGWFLFLLSSGSFFSFNYMFIYLIFGVLFFLMLIYGKNYFYLSDILDMDLSLGFWFWFSFLFFCSFPPMLGWLLKLFIYSSLSKFVLVFFVMLVNLFSTFGYLVVLSNFLVVLPFYSRLNVFFYFFSFSLLFVFFFFFN